MRAGGLHNCCCVQVMLWLCGRHAAAAAGVMWGECRRCCCLGCGWVLPSPAPARMAHHHRETSLWLTSHVPPPAAQVKDVWHGYSARAPHPPGHDKGVTRSVGHLTLTRWVSAPLGAAAANWCSFWHCQCSAAVHQVLLHNRQLRCSLLCCDRHMSCAQILLIAICCTLPPLHIVAGPCEARHHRQLGAAHSRRGG